MLSSLLFIYSAHWLHHMTLTTPKFSFSLRYQESLDIFSVHRNVKYAHMYIYIYIYIYI